MTRPIMVVTLASLGLLGAAAAAGQQSSTDAASRKIGILPFIDGTSSGSRESGVALSRTLQSALLNGSELTARVLTLDAGVRIEELNREQVIDLARRQKLDLVFLGTVLEAATSESSTGGWLPRIQGQQVNVRVRSVKAKVTLQGELYDVATGKTIATLRSTGDHSDNKFGGTLWSSLGYWDVGNSGFLDSPLGKAVQESIANLVKKISESVPARA
ncbi:MAG: hypothetical protein ACREMA_04615 [Longimicrobiales bacterium]